MRDQALDVLTGALAPALVFLGVWVTQRTGRRTSESQQALEAWKEFLAPLQERVTKLEEDLATEHAARKRGDHWRQLATAYIRRLVSTHHNPPAPPAELDLEETE